MTKIRSTLLALAVAATATAGTTAGAQSTAPATSQRAEHAKSDSAKWNSRGDKRRGTYDRDDDRREGEGRGEMGRGRGAMRGVNPTEAQRAQIRAIHEKYEPQFESLRATIKPAIDEAKAARQRGDTSAARAAFARTAASRQQAQALRVQEQGEIRAILTPAQQQAFDANIARQKARGDGMREGRGRRGRHN